MFNQNSTSNASVNLFLFRETSSVEIAIPTIKQIPLKGTSSVETILTIRKIHLHQIISLAHLEMECSVNQINLNPMLTTQKIICLTTIVNATSLDLDPVHVHLLLICSVVATVQEELTYF